MTVAAAHKKKITRKLFKKGGSITHTPVMTQAQKDKIKKYFFDKKNIKIVNNGENQKKILVNVPVSDNVIIKFVNNVKKNAPNSVCKIKDRFGDESYPIYIGQLADDETVPGIQVTQSPEEKRVYLMNDGYFYLNVDYSPAPSQRCRLKVLKVINQNLKNINQSFNGRYTAELRNGVYQFKIWNTYNGPYPSGAGKKPTTKKPVKKTTTKKPTTKKTVKKTTTKKPTTKKPVKKTTTKKPTTKKPVKKTTTKKPTTKKPVKKTVTKKPTTKKPVKKTTTKKPTTKKTVKKTTKK